jgi:outer membrane receptor protein involved in Fe transport
MDCSRGECMATKRLIESLSLAIVLAWTAGPASGQQHSGDRPVDFGDFSIEQLLRVEIKSASGLTKTDLRRAPVSLIELNADAIRSSGSRDINRLLELYVPNAQLIDHHHLQSHLGFRGIISDREDKYLFQVNGRTMNNRMFVGADNERAIPLLGDVQRVSVLRGPASATHGAGALAGVINLTPYNGLTVQGADVQVRQGAGDRFTTFQGRFGKSLSETKGFFAYYGVADQPGSNATYYLGKSYAARNGLPDYAAGQPLQAPTARYGAAGFGQLRHNAHASYTNDGFEM